MVKIPNFLFIGPDKTGSSWLNYVLGEHNDCFVPPAKDIWYFDKYYEKREEWYYSFFQDAPEDVKAIGELSHNYIFSKKAAERIAADLPEVKLLTCLRDPVKRTFSQYLYMKRSGVTKKPLREAIKENPRLIENSLYFKHLSVYFNYFPREQIKVLWFQNLKKDSEKFAREVFDFLDVPHDPTIDYDRRVRPAGEPRSFYLAKILKLMGLWVRELGLSNLVGYVKNSRLVNRVFYRKFESEDKPNIDSELEAVLRDRFRDDVLSLENLLDVDLSRWLDSNNANKARETHKDEGSADK